MELIFRPNRRRRRLCINDDPLKSWMLFKSTKSDWLLVEAAAADYQQCYWSETGIRKAKQTEDKHLASAEKRTKLERHSCSPACVAAAKERKIAPKFSVFSLRLCAQPNGTIFCERRNRRAPVCWIGLLWSVCTMCCSPWIFWIQPRTHTHTIVVYFRVCNTDLEFTNRFDSTNPADPQRELRKRTPRAAPVSRRHT